MHVFHRYVLYICQETSVRRGGKVCQTVPGKVVDAAAANLMIEMMTPMTLAVTLDVQRELEARAAETGDLRRKHVERLRYDADLARQRYMRVDPLCDLEKNVTLSIWGQTRPYFRVMRAPHKL
jgi:hypothetical protein